jgi:hypothetical protein
MRVPKSGIPFGSLFRLIPFARSRTALLVLLVGCSILALRPAGAASFVGRSSHSPVGAKDLSLGFPITPVGQSSTLCTNVCYCTDPSACDCDSSGTIALNHDVSSPFAAYGYRLESVGSADDCNGGTPVQLPVFVDAGQKVVYTVSFAPTQVGSFSDTLDLSGYNLFLAGSTPSGSPDLIPYRPSGWSEAVVVSTVAGTQQNSGTITSSDTLYVSWAVQNDGNAPTSETFYSDLYLDGTLLQRWHSDPPLAAGSYVYVADFSFGPLSPGTHTLILVSDETATAGPSSTYTKTFTVGTSGAPALAPYQPSGWSAPVVVSVTPGTQVDSPTLSSSQTLYASYAVANVGSAATTATFYSDLLLDGAPLQTFYSNPPLSPGNYTYLKDYSFGPLAPGVHTLELVVDSTRTVGGSPTYTKTFTVASPLPPPPSLMPATSTSWYIKATRPYQQDSALYAWAYQAGQKAGQLNAVAGNANFVILDFGEPWKFSNGGYGASGFGRPLTVSEIASVVKQFVLGYETATHLGLFLAAGTTNNGPYVSVAHAQAWAKMLTGLDGWVASEGFSVKLSSANDAELGFTSGPQLTQKWFQAFRDAIAASGRAILSYDYGDAEACPTTPATSAPQPCGTTGWTQKDIADLHALYIPEIYNNSTAREWEEISLYIDLRSGQTGDLIKGPLSQSKACTIAANDCLGTNNTPLLAWRQIVRALNSSTTTAPGVPGLMWSTDINWNTNKNQ